MAADRLFDPHELAVNRDAVPLDSNPDAERQRRFQIAHLLIERNLRHIALDLQVSVRTVERWVVDGVTWDTADLLCARVLNVDAMSTFGPDWAAEADAAIGAVDGLFDDDLSDLIRQEAP